MSKHSGYDTFIALRTYVQKPEDKMRKDSWSTGQRSGAWMHITFLYQFLGLGLMAMFGGQGILISLGIACFIGIPAWNLYQNEPWPYLQRFRYHTIPLATTLALTAFFYQTTHLTVLKLLLVGFTIGACLEGMTAITIRIGMFGVEQCGEPETRMTHEERRNYFLDKFCEACSSDPHGTSREHGRLVTQITRMRMEAGLRKESQEAELQIWRHSS